MPASHRASRIGFLLLLILSAVSPLLAQKAPRPSPAFDVTKVTDGIYACVRREAPSLWFTPNNVFIVGKKEVAVVDSSISSAYASEVIDALKRITNKPVKYLINTHWHEDHIGGNRAWQKAYPGLQIVGHRSTLTDYPKIGAVNRKGGVENGSSFVKMLRDAIDKGTDLAGQKITEEGRLGYSSDIDIVTSYLSDAADAPMMPTLLVDEKLRLDLDGQTIDVMFLGRAHTAADLVVHLPKKHIVASGDLTAYPVPLVGSTSYPLEYGSTLEKLLALKARILIPGHGPVMRDDYYVKLMTRLLHTIKAQVEAAITRGNTLEQARKGVDLKEFESAFCGDSQHRRFVFRNYVTLPAVAAAYSQAKEIKK
ncbi:MAG TPA: MBL fold metallo-hydrolase [Pyrinomonadaceae bacterium]|nr:MBL fold metallo-hydrolase [Pyrinomonadaceae bacterium]